MSHPALENLAAVDNAFDVGAGIAGLDIVCSGRIQNTFAAWHIISLVSVNGFTSDTGVEAMDPFIRFAQIFGCCIAPIRVVGGKLNMHTDASLTARHQEVMESKVARQQDRCEFHEVDFTFLERAILPPYPIMV